MVVWASVGLDADVDDTVVFTSFFFLPKKFMVPKLFNQNVLLLQVNFVNVWWTQLFLLDCFVGFSSFELSKSRTSVICLVSNENKMVKTSTKRFLLSPDTLVIANAVLALFSDRCLVLDEPCK